MESYRSASDEADSHRAGFELEGKRVDRQPSPRVRARILLAALQPDYLKTLRGRSSGARRDPGSRAGALPEPRLRQLVDIAAQLNENRERAAFIHMQIYRDSVVEQGSHHRRGGSRRSPGSSRSIGREASPLGSRVPSAPATSSGAVAAAVKL